MSRSPTTSARSRTRRRSAPTGNCLRATKRQSSNTTIWLTSPAAEANGASRVADAGKIGERAMALFLLLIIVAIALGIVGAVVKGLLYLLIIGVGVLLADLVLAGVRLRRSGRRPTRERPAPAHRGRPAPGRPFGGRPPVVHAGARPADWTPVTHRVARPAAR